MTRYRKEITKEFYERCNPQPHKINRVPDELKPEIFSEAQLWGYGIYSTSVYERDGKYFVEYEQGDTCD